ncbi:hypothetical protein [Pseudofrankia sp. BMG5.37]|uniref:hypothetical protein n=1 Tax=Pseudofrankia sp. BMG5.37 TaxID=3050035 RepID=UPI0028960DCC|nr:hypothetical protein [Pseudofrankia sp. BMG5.37]MDT3443594.1 hypothetical protein [Pseudofrankia sp. BMG5.37]
MADTDRDIRRQEITNRAGVRATRSFFALASDETKTCTATSSHHTAAEGEAAGQVMPPA